jgi:hypothetical protein
MSRFMTPLFWIPAGFKIENRSVDPFVCRDHGVDGKILLNVLATSPPVDFGKPLQGPHRLVHVVYKKPGASILDHLAAGSEVHSDHGYPSGVGFREHEPESLRYRIQVQKRSGSRE